MPGGPHREAPGSIRRQVGVGNVSQRPCWFLPEGTGGTGPAGSETSLDSFSRLWALGALPWCLTPGLGHRAGGSGSEGESLMEEVAGGWDGLVCIGKAHSQTGGLLAQGIG